MAARMSDKVNGGRTEASNSSSANPTSGDSSITGRTGVAIALVKWFLFSFLSLTRNLNDESDGDLANDPGRHTDRQSDRPPTDRSCPQVPDWNATVAAISAEQAAATSTVNSLIAEVENMCEC